MFSYSRATPGMAESLKENGNELFKLGNIQAAIKAYTKALELQPDSKLRLMLYKNRALARLEMKDFEDAEMDCDKALELNPADPKARYRRALAREKQDKFEPALADAKEALRLQPGDKVLMELCNRLVKANTERLKKQSGENREEHIPWEKIWLPVPENIKFLVNKWMNVDGNNATFNEIHFLVVQKKYDELLERLNGELAFGTAGVRARMGAGFTRLNDLTILQLSHGFAKRVTKLNKSEPAIVIGYDGRHNSKRFALLSANVFVQNGVRVHLFSDCVPTPVVSFAVVELKCSAGLMITASHNPKEDNGYKAYWNNGAQIQAPNDDEICEIARNDSLKPEYWNYPNADYCMLHELEKHPLLEKREPLMGAYFKKEGGICCFYKSLNTTSKLRITYSAFHGVGSIFAQQMFEEFGFPAANISYVQEQNEPNPDFPTVPFPNPEEGHRVLQLCFRTADANNAQVILANDPDAGRLQLAEKQPDSKWRVFTGNEMGALASWWLWTQWRQRNFYGTSLVHIVTSAVSSQIAATMAQKEGFQNDVSLPGFKWIGNKADHIRELGETVILAWEESIGFSMGSTHDKDGVSAAAVFAEMANWLRSQQEPLTLQQQLFAIYRQYGFHLTKNSYWIVPGPEVTKKLFADLRGNNGYPAALGASGRIKFVRDLTTGFDNSQPTNKAVLPLSRTSEMVTFTLDTGSIVTLRSSETAPKVKYYIELRTEPGKTERDLPDLQRTLEQLERDVVETLLQPNKYGLINRDG